MTTTQNEVTDKVLALVEGARALHTGRLAWDPYTLTRILRAAGVTCVSAAKGARSGTVTDRHLTVSLDRTRFFVG